MALGGGTRFAERDARRDADHVGFLRHKHWRWMWIALVLSLAVGFTYMSIDVEPRHNGGSWYGYTLGTMGAGLIVWLSLLGIRKRRMTEGRWSLKAWTSAHVYLGLALIVIGTLHTGLQLGWNVHTLAWALMMLVIVSGMYGIAVYALLPSKLADNRKQMTKGEMLDALAATDRQIDTASQTLDRTEAVVAALRQDPFASGILARLTNSYPGCRTAAALRELGEGHDDASRKVVELLTKRQAQLAQLRRQMKLRAMLDVWLWVHVPVTVALLAALTAHIISVFYYW